MVSFLRPLTAALWSWNETSINTNRLKRNQSSVCAASSVSKIGFSECIELERELK